MANAIQATRHIAIDTPLGDNALLLRSFSAHEEISRLFEIDLDLLSENPAIDFDDIIGQSVTISVNLPAGGTRLWNGYISRFVQGVTTSRRFAQYRATMVPWLWFLTLTSDCRIFQEKKVPQIITQIFNDLGFGDFEDRTSGGYRTWTYCVQYRETDFNFVSRLMEQEGIYYYFKHEQGKCTLVLCDSRSKHDFYGDYSKIPFTPEIRSSSLQEYISEWTVDKKIRSGKFAHTDYDPLKPNTPLITVDEDKKGHAQADYEIYDFPGEYTEKSDGDKYAKVRMEEMATAHMMCSGQSDSRGICSGYLFTMDRHPQRNLNQDYLVLSTTCHASAEDYETLGGQDELWSCSFTAIPSTVQFRPERTTPKPVIMGAQTAVVTGPSGEEIWTDKYGRVIVQFHWDRYGKHDENSSCWVRVSHPTAGKGWGAVQIPRIGQEVIVDFLEGDPDLPIITGRVYNADQMPPFALPGSGMVAGMKSNSTPGGGGCNEMTMDDTKGQEKIAIHGQYNMDTTVENDQTLTVHNNRTSTIDVNEAQTVGVDQTINVGSNQSSTIGADQSLSVGVNQNVSIGSNQDTSIGSNQTINVSANYSQTVGGNHSTSIGGKHSETVGGNSTITIGGLRTETAGAGLIINNPRTAMNVGGKCVITAGGSLTESSPKVNINASSKMTASSGGPVTVKAGGEMKQQSGGAFSIKSGGAVKEQSGGAFNIKAGGALNQQGANINLKGPTKVAGKTKITGATKIKGNTLTVG